MIDKSCYYNSKDNYCKFKNQYIDNCNIDCKYFGAVLADVIRCGHHLDDFFDRASKVTPIEGFDDFAMHANTLYFINKTIDGKDIIVSVEDVAEIIREYYKGNVPNLRLISCNAGLLDTKDGVAQKLANILNIKVIAAKGTVKIFKDGELSVVDPFTKIEYKDQSLWKLFTPNKEI